MKSPPNPFLSTVLARAARFRKRLEELIWLDREALETDWIGASRRHRSFAEALRAARRRIHGPFFWGRACEQAWFRVRIPPRARSGGHYLVWKEQGEATVYHDGTPYAGLDAAHPACRIPAGARILWIEALCLEAGIWVASDRPSVTARGCRFEAVYAARRDDGAARMLQAFLVLLDLLEDECRLSGGDVNSLRRGYGSAPDWDAASPLQRRVARRLDEAMNAMDAGGLNAAAAALRAAYRELKFADSLLRCRLIGHAHLDLVWLWTEEAATFKAVHTWATALRLMEDDPDFVFAQSQPAAYRAVATRAPALLERVKQQIRNGRWEALGAMEVEADTQLACGEALLRSFLLARAAHVAWWGRPSETLWLPDTFGFSACLPQLMQLTGVRYFYTAKLDWNPLARFPYSSFRWQGADGSEVLAYAAQGSGYAHTAFPSELRKAARAYRQADVHDEILLPTGYGDGGGGPTAEMCERARLLRNLAGVPVARWGRVDAFFRRLARARGRLPVWRGELPLHYHRGAWTTHAALKRAYRAAERALQTLEAARTLAGAGPADERAWQRLAFAQFHDLITGSSVREVYEQAIPELRALARAARREARAVAAPGGPMGLLNPLPLARTEWIAGRTRRVPPLCIYAPSRLPPLPRVALHASSRVLASDRVQAQFDAGGRIESLVVDGAPLAAAGALGALRLYPDRPHAFDAWEIDRSAFDSPMPVAQPTRVRAFVKSGYAGLRIAYSLGSAGSAVVEYGLRPHRPVLEIRYDVEWRARHVLMKVLFPTAYCGRCARFGTPFGSVLRGQHPGRPDDEAQWEVCGSRWAVVSDDADGEGLFVVTEATYGWSCRSGLLAVSLLRAPTFPRRAHDTAYDRRRRARYSHTDQGRHCLRMAIGRYHAGLPRVEQPAAWAETLFTPLLRVSAEPRHAGFLGLEGGASLLPAWSIPEADGAWILRLHETLGRRGSARLRLARGWAARAITPLGMSQRGVLVDSRLYFEPYQVLSLRLDRAAD
jgi:alpha-mannosidase